MALERLGCHQHGGAHVENVGVLALLLGLEQVGEAGLGAEERAPGVDLVEEVVVLYGGVGHVGQPDGARVVYQDVNTFIFAYLFTHCVFLYYIRLSVIWLGIL